MSTTWFRNARTVGTCGALKALGDPKVLCGAVARLLPAGCRCDAHRPAVVQVARALAAVR